MSGNLVALVLALYLAPGLESPRLPLSLTAPSAADDRGCLSCHPFPARLTHPLGVLGSAKTPPDLPLDGEGRLRCRTCHEIEVGHRGRGSTRLRRAPAELCRGCHSERHGDSLHSVSLDTAHMSGFGKSISGLDPESRLCLSCHDGAFAASATGSSEDADRVNHPIGVPYVSGRDRKLGDTAMLPVTGLPPEVRLFEGRVGCGSCHSPFARSVDLLAVEMRESRLCYSCHEL